MCSPLHDLANLATGVAGVLLVVGTVLLRQVWPSGRAASVASALLALGGVLRVLVAVAPEDVSNVHALAGLGYFVATNAGLISFAIALRRVRPAGWASFAAGCGFLGSVALVVLLSGNTFGLGFGGIERVTADLPTVWQVVTAVAVLAGVRFDRRLVAGRPA